MNSRNSSKIAIFVFFTTFLLNSSFFAQNLLTLPRVSPQANVSQTIGLSTVTIDYHRPAVKGRKIWGELVPYGLTNLGFGLGNPAPWRAGANENTTITFSDDAVVEGNKVAAGTYGLHMIPTENEWTIIISTQTTGWGSFFYDEKEDYLRFKVTPKEAPFTEWLYYGFSDLTSNSCDVYLQWEKLRVPFNVQFDVHAVVINSFEKELVGAPGFNWQAFNQAAVYTVNNNVYLDKGLEWANRAVGMNRSMPSLATKSRILKAMGKNDEAEELLSEALDIGSEAELNQYGYQLMGVGDMENTKKIFILNVEKNPDSWNVYDSLGEYYRNSGDIDKARENYETAKNLAPENQKGRIEQIISTL